MKYPEYGTLSFADGTIAGEHTGIGMDQLIGQRPASRSSRRGFLATAGVAAGAAAAVGLSGCSDSGLPPITPPSPAPTYTEIDVLNFALNLEYLEASFYLYITTGKGLGSADMGTLPGAVTGITAAVAFTDPNVTALAQQLAADEQAHVQFLRSLITAAGSTPVAMPALNLAAMGAITNDATFLSAARQLETVGVSAYEGGILAFTSDLPGLTYAARIHDTEAQHEGNLRQFCIAKGVTSGAVDGLDKPPVAGAVFNTNANGLNAVRTPSQVLQIVYGAPSMTGISKGGFFPNGMNGTIKTS